MNTDGILGVNPTDVWQLSNYNVTYSVISISLPLTQLHEHLLHWLELSINLGCIVVLDKGNCELRVINVEINNGEVIAY